MPDTPCNPWNDPGSSQSGGPSSPVNGQGGPSQRQPVSDNAQRQIDQLRQRIDGLMAQAAERLQQCSQGCSERVGRQLDQCGERLTECQAVIQGELTRRLGRAEAALEQIRHRMDSRLTDALRSCYLCNLQLGLPVPGAAQVAAELAQPPTGQQLLQQIAAGEQPQAAGPEEPAELGPAPAEPAEPGEPAELGPPPRELPEVGVQDLGRPLDDQPRPPAGRPQQAGELGPPAPPAVVMPDPFHAERQQPGQGGRVRLQGGGGGQGGGQQEQEQQPVFMGFNAEREVGQELPDWCSDKIEEEWRQRIAQLRDVGIGGRIGPTVMALPWYVRPIVLFAIGLPTFLMNFVPAPRGCNRVTAVMLATLLGVANFLRQWMGIDFWAARTSLEQSIKVLCPQEVPSVEQAVEFHLSDQATQAKGRLWTKANGHCEKTFDMAAKSRRTRPNVNENVALWLREYFDEPILDKQLRELGVTENQERQGFKELAKYIPTPQELISFMVRDAFDERIVARFKYDDDFQAKFTGQVKKWAKAQGMTEEQFKYNWRAHWRLASPTQAYECLHRLRPGVVAGGLVTTKQDVEDLLKTDDMAPFWVPRLVEISYSPLTRIDAKRAYFVDAITRPELRDAYLDLGYDERRADQLLKFADLEKMRFVAGQLGLPTPRTLMTDFSELIIDQGEFRQGLAVYGFSPAAINNAVQAAGQKSLRRLKRQASRAVKKRYMLGVMNDTQASAALQQRGFSAQASIMLVQEWGLDRDMKGRLLTAPVLCRLAVRGLVGPEEYLAGLVRLGYSQADALRLASACAGDDFQKRQKQARAAMEKAQKEVEKRARDARKEGEQAVKAEASRIKAIDAARRRADRDAERLCKQRATLAQATDQPPPIYVEGECFIPKGADDGSESKGS